MSFETLIVAVLAMVILYFFITYVIPGPYQRIALIVLACIAALWLFRNIHALLHCCH